MVSCWSIVGRAAVPSRRMSKAENSTLDNSSIVAQPAHRYQKHRYFAEASFIPHRDLLHCKDLAGGGVFADKLDLGLVVLDRDFEDAAP